MNTEVKIQNKYIQSQTAQHRKRCIHLQRRTRIPQRKKLELMKTTTKTKPTTTTSEAFSAIRFQLIGMSFVYHTLCRLISEKTKCDYRHAEKLASEMLAKKWIVTAAPIGLTETPTFKLADQ